MSDGLSTPLTAQPTGNQLALRSAPLIHHSSTEYHNLEGVNQSDDQPIPQQNSSEKWCCTSFPLWKFHWQAITSCWDPYVTAVLRSEFDSKTKERVMQKTMKFLQVDKSETWAGYLKTTQQVLSILPPILVPIGIHGLAAVCSVIGTVCMIASGRCAKQFGEQVGDYRKITNEYKAELYQLLELDGVDGYDYKQSCIDAYHAFAAKVQLLDKKWNALRSIADEKKQSRSPPKVSPLQKSSRDLSLRTPFTLSKRDLQGCEPLRWCFWVACVVGCLAVCFLGISSDKSISCMVWWVLGTIASCAAAYSFEKLHSDLANTGGIVVQLSSELQWANWYGFGDIVHLLLEATNLESYEINYILRLLNSNCFNINKARCCRLLSFVFKGLQAMCTIRITVFAANKVAPAAFDFSLGNPSFVAWLSVIFTFLESGLNQQATLEKPLDEKQASCVYETKLFLILAGAYTTYQEQSGGPDEKARAHKAAFPLYMRRTSKLALDTESLSQNPEDLHATTSSNKAA